MPVFLEAILFNHDSGGTTSGALTIRRNETELVPLPEWQRNSAANEACSPAAYVISKLPEPLTIKARFSSPDLKGKAVDVMAEAAAGAVLGNVEKETVTFDANGDSGFVPFKLLQASLKGVSVSTTKWTWNFSPPAADDWTKFEETCHRIYVVMTEPTAPWEAELPWAEVLEHACKWAAGATTEPEAATMVTEQVYRLGETRLTHAGSSTYAKDKFDCTAFLQLLSGGIGNAQAVNCDDCATIVSTFANILGCDLYQSEMGSDFHTNFVRLIGETEFDTTGFYRHAVAWKNDCGVGDPLYDAFLQVDNDKKPANNTNIDPLLPANLVFGKFGDKVYKFCLVMKGSPQCIPKPKLKKRRPLGKNSAKSQAVTNPKLLTATESFYEFDSWANDKGVDQTTSELSLPDLLREHSAFAEWESGPVKEDPNEDLVVTLQALLRRPAGDSQELVELDLYECKSSASPSRLVLQVLAQCNQRLFERWASEPIGDVTFVTPRKTMVLFKRGKFVALARSVGRQAVSVFAMAQAIEQYFAARVL
jgi:hypothetical protein